MKAEDLKVELNAISFEESRYVFNDNVWYAETLVNAAKDLPIFDLPLYAIDIGVVPFRMTTAKDFADHMYRVDKVDLTYPVIMDTTGYICDGWHRVIKALLFNLATIKAKRLLEMPEPDEYVDSED